jgi:hypothetical protein
MKRAAVAGPSASSSWRIFLTVLSISLIEGTSYAVGPDIPGDFATWEQGTYFVLDTCLPLIVVGYPAFFLANLIMRRTFVESLKGALKYFGYFIGLTYLTGIFFTMFVMITLSVSTSLLKVVWPSYTMGLEQFLTYSTIAFYSWSAACGLWIIRWIHKDMKEATVSAGDKKTV